MAYSFGGGIRPELGRTDYSGYLQGALQGARSNAAGSAAIGQGIASIGQSIGSGMVKGTERADKMKERDRLLKEQEKMKIGQVKAASTTLRGLTMDESLPSEVRNQAYRTLSELDNPYANPDEKFAIATQASDSVKQLLGIKKDVASSKGTELDNQLKQGQIDALKTAQGPMRMTTQQVEEYRERGYDFDGSVDSDGIWTVKNLSPFAPKSDNIINVGDNTESKETSKAKVERNIKLLDSAASGVSTMRKTKELADVLNSGDVNLGLFSKLNQAKDRFIAGFGGEDALKRATTTQIAEAYMGSEVFQLFQQLGVGARGLDTPAERDFMMKVLTGDVTMQKEAILAMAKRRFDEAKRSVEKFNGRVEESEGYRNWVKEYNYDIPKFESMDWGSGGEKAKPVRTWNPSTGTFQ